MDQDLDKENGQTIDLSQFSKGYRQKTQSPYPPTTPKMVKGIVKLSGGRFSIKQATYILWILAIVLATLTIIIFINTLNGSAKAPKKFRGDAPSNLEEFEKSLSPSG